MHLIEQFNKLLALLEAKKKNIPEPEQKPKAEEQPQEKPKYNARIIAGDMHVKSLKNIRHLKSVINKTSELLEKKRQDPHGKLSDGDYALGTNGGFADFPGLMHTPVSHNLRLWYAVVPVKKGKETVWQFIQPYLKSTQEFELRFGIVMLLHYIDEGHIDLLLKYADSFCHDAYYARMAMAWMISICFASAL